MSPAPEWSKGTTKKNPNDPFDLSSKISLRGNTPGPGTYTYENKQMGTEASKFSFRRRTIDGNGKKIKLFKRVQYEFFI